MDKKVFINTPSYAKEHRNAIVIETGGILLEIDKFEVGAELRQQLSRGIIKKVEKDHFIVKWDLGFKIRYPLPYTITDIEHLSLTEEDMYLYEFERKENKKIIKIEQLQFDI